MTSATESTSKAMVEAQAQLSTYRKSLKEAKANRSTLERRLAKGDEGVTAAALTKTAGEIDRLEILVNAAKAKVATASKADNLARTDRYVSIIADVFADKTKGYIPVVHLPDGVPVPEVDRRTIFVALDRRSEGKFDAIGGTVTAHAMVYSASPGLDDNALLLLPGYGHGKAYVPPVVGAAGQVGQIQWGQKQPRRQVGETVVFGVAMKATIAAGLPTLANRPGMYNLNSFGQSVRGELKRRQYNHFGSDDTMALDVLDITKASHGSKVEDEGAMVSTYRATVAVNIGDSKNNQRAADSLRHRLDALVGRHYSALGRLVSIEYGQPKYSGLVANGTPTTNIVGQFPITATFKARLAGDDD